MNQIAWHVELAIKPGQIENFRLLTGVMVASTRTEAGVLSYQRFISDDGRSVHVWERYADSPAALAHLIRFKNEFGDRFLTMVERTRFTVFGSPSDELRELLDEFDATYFKPFGDFAYWA